MTYNIRFSMLSEYPGTWVTVIFPPVTKWNNISWLNYLSVRRLCSVMQSVGNSFCGDVVLDSFNNACRVEDSILDQMYEKQICSDFTYKGLSFVQHLTKIHTYIRKALKPKCLVLECCITLDMHFLRLLLIYKVFIIKIQKYLLFIYQV